MPYSLHPLLHPVHHQHVLQQAVEALRPFLPQWQVERAVEQPSQLFVSRLQEFKVVGDVQEEEVMVERVRELRGMLTNNDPRWKEGSWQELSALSRAEAELLASACTPQQ